MQVAGPNPSTVRCVKLWTNAPGALFLHCSLIVDSLPDSDVIGVAELARLAESPIVTVLVSKR